MSCSMGYICFTFLCLSVKVFLYIASSLREQFPQIITLDFFDSGDSKTFFPAIFESHINKNSLIYHVGLQKPLRSYASITTSWLTFMLQLLWWYNSEWQQLEQGFFLDSCMKEDVCSKGACVIMHVDNWVLEVMILELIEKPKNDKSRNGVPLKNGMLDISFLQKTFWSMIDKKINNRRMHKKASPACCYQ